MVERAKDSGPEWNGLRTGPVPSLSEALKSLPGDQFHLLSQLNSDQSSISISSPDANRGLGEPETLMALMGEYDAYEDARDRWASDREPKKSLATKVKTIALIAMALAIVIAIPLVFFENNKRVADATAPRIAAPKPAATETAPAVASKSSESQLATAEQNRPRDPAKGLNPVLIPKDTAADANSGSPDQNVASAAPAAAQGPAGTANKQEFATSSTSADTRSMGQGENVSPPAPAAPQSPPTTVDKAELTAGPAPDQTKSMVQGQNAASQPMADPHSPTGSIEKEESAAGPSPDQTAADAKSMAQAQNAPSQAPAATQGPTGTSDQEKLAAGPAPEQTIADAKPVDQVQNAAPRAPAAPRSTARSTERTIDQEQLAFLLKKGRDLLGVGDIASARLLLERAADAHDASAAFALAGTYDPVVLRQSRVLGIVPDVTMARMWYEIALGLGQSEARERLAQLQK